MDPLTAALQEEQSYQPLAKTPTMPKDPWLAGCDSARVLADQIQGYIQERVSKYPNGGTEASKLTAQARRLAATLASQIQRLREGLDEESDNLSKAERNRRNDILTNLNLRREQMLESLSRTYAVARGELLGSSSTPNGPAQDTEETADLDSRGLLQLQKDRMRDQDELLNNMETTVDSTKHIALAIGEEVDLQKGLLDQMDQEVDIVGTRLVLATRRINHIIKKTPGWGWCLIILLLIIVLVVIVVIVIKFA
eukprot:TRINITY_DN32852_c0_g1_i1.p1 TRINITY_DN32852_c0_g1~~TRINITY_DN32852_c0_g1_i1.p1  ORF type:complete len:253 (+),score=27.02 TRINITY_DN32852_c0_g1_i1:111-869(+)